METPIAPLARLRLRDSLLYLNRNRTVLATGRDGFIRDGEQGLFVYQTRVLSRLLYRINGIEPKPAGVSNLDEHSQIAYYICKAPLAEDSAPTGNGTEEALELRLNRWLSDGMLEEIHLANHTLSGTRFRLEIEVDADFADTQEAEGKRKQHGAIERRWQMEQDQCNLSWTYRAAHQYAHQGNQGEASLECAATVVIRDADQPPEFEEESGRIRFDIDLPPHGTWHASLLVSARIDGHTRDAGLPAADPEHYRVRQNYLENTARVRTCPALAYVVERSMEQARRDLIGFRLADLDRPDGAWTLSAGLPAYTAFFGRDALTASWQASLFGDHMMRGTLACLADTQATNCNDWRDEQPGRFVHQMDTGPLAQLCFNPLGRYYGALTTPGFYPVALSNLWHWTGDLDLARSFLDPALKGLAWLDRSALREDGFYAYQTRSEQGLKNQAWKDSGDAIVYPDGSQVKTPIAPCEFQAFVFAAKVRMSELLWWLGEKDQSRRFFDRAMALRERFNEVFWMEEEGCFGMGLDPNGELIRSVGSESAHAVAAGIVAQNRVERTIRRLFEPDLFSGWGLRTLSARHPAFNPFSYHRGSVWPAEQAAFCMGLMRYGERDRLNQVTKAQFEVAALFDYFRLPEVFAGHQRDREHPIPGLYPRAGWPQAWSDSAVPCMIQAMLGLFPYAPLKLLFLDPHLPDWLPELQLQNVRVGKAAVDLRFHRTADGATHYQVSQLRGKLHVIRQASPWLHLGVTERLVEVLSSLVPGH